MTALARAPARRWPKYAAHAALGLREAVNERATLLGRSVFYAVILVVFTQLWHAVDVASVLSGFAASDLIWYVALTEWITLSVPLVHLEIEADVRSGDVAYRLPRPLSYLGAQIAHSAGELALRLTTLGGVGFGLAWLLADGPPAHSAGLLAALPLGVAGALLGLQLQAAIGLLAFWYQDCSPFFWIYQKALFLLGGLMLPLDAYPGWLRELALWTPFASMLDGAAGAILGIDVSGTLDVAARLVVWNALAAGALLWLYRRALRTLEVNGG